MNEIHITPNAIIAVECNNPKYTVGVGVEDNWQTISYSMGEITCTTFPCEWTNVYGNDVFVAESQNIKELATIRMGYNPDILTALNATEVRIYRNGDTKEENAFTVYGSADNIKLQNKMLEFKVRRLAVKPSGD